jgi:haloalkane dehalogenase
MMGDAVGRELIERFNLFVNLMIPAGHRRRKLSNAEMAHYRSALGTPARREASAIFPRAITRSRAFLAQVETNLHTLDRLPALTVWGDADFAFRAKERIRWEGLLHDRSTVVIHGAGHFVQSDAPDDFAEAISTWHAMPGAKGPTHE